MPYTVCGDCRQAVTGLAIDRANNEIYYADTACNEYLTEPDIRYPSIFLPTQSHSLLLCFYG